MTITGYSNAVVDLMLGWLKGFANWVLRLFNLAGSAGTSPLLWLSQNWMKLLIFFLALGVILDIVIWLIRWRPYWVWFRKERVIVNDDRFFENADMDKAEDWEEDLIGNWDEHDYVVASTVVKRHSGAGAQKGKPGQPPRIHRRSAKVALRDDRPEQRRAKPVQEAADEAPDSIFTGKLRKKETVQAEEDEVFNVASLPSAREEGSPRRRKS